MEHPPGPVADTPESLRAVAEAVAERAAMLVRRRRTELLVRHASLGSVAGAVDTKTSATDPVTVVDRESEVLIRRELARLRPGDAILGEEEGHAGSTDGGVLWVVDPIDGTVNFLYGVPHYAVSVAATSGGEPVAGAVVDVPGGVRYSAARGQGATRRGPDGTVTPLRASAATDLGTALVATGFGYDAGRRAAQGALVARLLPRVRDIRRIGAAALDLCLVAEGRLDAYYEHGLGPWDRAAGVLIATEAGARLRVPAADSGSPEGELTAAAAPGVWEAFAALLVELGADAPLD